MKEDCYISIDGTKTVYKVPLPVKKFFEVQMEVFVKMRASVQESYKQGFEDGKKAVQKTDFVEVKNNV